MKTLPRFAGLVLALPLIACPGDDTGDTGGADTASTPTSTAADSTTDGGGSTDAADSTTDAPGSTGTPGSTTDDASTGAVGAEFEQEIYPIIMANCSCHLGAAHPTGLTMGTAAEAYSNLVGVDSGQNPGMARVTPSSAQDSYLFHKVSGTQMDVGGSGGRMPLNMPPLTKEDIGAIQLWIDNGAQ
ncbi:MAG: hypothetical protein K0V04_11595 [Deltaproteobacteria bacterium]|nr:hypothetical protein [Deltaproteobacteria bacterium]